MLLALCVFLGVESIFRLVKPELAIRRNQFRINAQKTTARQHSAIKEPDPDLMWRLKAGCRIFDGEVLNSRGFRTGEFSIQKPAGTHRIVILGDSRSFGFGVIRREALYSERIASFLNRSNLMGPVEVINLSVIGYSSFQGAVLSETLVEKLAPDTLIIWFGFNDLLYYHVVDHHAVQSARLTRCARHVLNNLHIYHWFRNIIERQWNPNNDPIHLEQVITRRVPLPYFRKNLERMIRQARQQNARVLLMTTPVRPDIPMVMNSKKRVFQGDDGRLYARLLTQYEIEDYWLMDTMTFPGSESELDRLLEMHPDMAILHYYKAQFHRENGNIGAAEKELDLAETLDDTRRTVAEYNAVIRETARSTGASLVDLVPIFSQYEDLNLFVDDCHPGNNGHGIIAGQVISTLTGLPPEVRVTGP